MNTTTFQHDNILNYTFGSGSATSYDSPSNWYLGLSTTQIFPSGSGVTEPTDAAYARVTIVNNKTRWSTSTSGSLTNITALTFPTSTTSWGTIKYIFLATGSMPTNGCVCYYDEADPYFSVGAGTAITFNANSIGITGI